MRRDTGGAVAGIAPAVLTIGLLFGAALLGAVRTSLQPGPAGLLGEVSADAWRAVFADPAFLDALRFTLWISAAATVLAAIAAVAFAAGLRRLGAVARGAFGVPVLVPHLVVAVVAVVWVGSGGLVQRILGTLPLDLVRDPAGLGVILVYAYKEAPFLTLLVLAVWDRDVADLEEAAAVLGADRWRRMRLVVWPAIRPALLIGALIVAAFAFGSFEVPLVVGPNYPPTLAVLALQETQTAVLAGQARAAAILLVAAVVSVLLAIAVVRRLRDVDV